MASPHKIILRLYFADGLTEIILCPFSCPDVSAPDRRVTFPDREDILKIL
ncbi:MAG: hypothetical protein JRF43_08155 [Deltaproteobacteria bacterium]|nr:hypothetical protein [Deltaproteobacteria bacterium]